MVSDVVACWLTLNCRASPEPDYKRPRNPFPFIAIFYEQKSVKQPPRSGAPPHGSAGPGRPQPRAARRRHHPGKAAPGPAPTRPRRAPRTEAAQLWRSKEAPEGTSGRRAGGRCPCRGRGEAGLRERLRENPVPPEGKSCAGLSSGSAAGRACPGKRFWVSMGLRACGEVSLLRVTPGPALQRVKRFFCACNECVLLPADAAALLSGGGTAWFGLRASAGSERGGRGGTLFGGLGAFCSSSKWWVCAVLENFTDAGRAISLVHLLKEKL